MLLNKKETELRKIMSFLKSDEKFDLTSNLVKINPNKISDIVINYTEVEKLIKKSKFYWCLE